MALSVKNITDGAYQARQDILGPVAAGSGGVSNKFLAFANIVLFGLMTYTTALGTSTYTQTVNGTATGTGTASGQQIWVCVVTNTNTASNTTTVALATTSIGPFLAGGNGTAAQVGGLNQWALNTNTGTQGQGGVLVPAGSLVFAISGTDTTAVTNITVDYQIQPAAALTI
jgi:hypothetical protein